MNDTDDYLKKAGVDDNYEGLTQEEALAKIISNLLKIDAHANAQFRRVRIQTKLMMGAAWIVAILGIFGPEIWRFIINK